MAHPTWRRLAGAFFLCAALGQPAAASETLARLLSGFTAPLTARHGLVAEDAAAGSLVVYELSLARADGWTLKAAKLAVERLDEAALARALDPATPKAGPADPAPPPFARRIVADEVELKHGSVAWRVAQVVLDAPSLRPAGRPVPGGIAGLLALDPLTELLPNVSAAAIRLQKVAELDGQARLRADELSAEGVDRGRVARLGGRLVELQGGGPDDDNGAVARLSAAGLDLIAIVAAFQGRLPATHAALAESVTLDGFAISGPKTNITLKEARLDRLGLRASRGGAAALGSADPAAWADFIGMATLGRLELRELAIDLPPTYEGGLDRLLIEGLDGERLRLYRSDGLRWRDGPHRIEQASVELRDLVFGPLAALLAAGGMPDANSENLLTLERFSLRGSSYEDPTTGRQRVDEITLGRFRHRGLLPTAFELRIGGVEVDVSNLGDTDSTINEGRDFLLELGYEELKLDFEIGFEWRPDGGRIVIRPVALGVREAGKLALSLELAGIDPAAFGGGFDWTALMQAAVAGASLRYEDESLFERVLAYAAEEAERSVDSTRRKLLREIDKERRAHAGDPLMGRLLDAVTAFVRKPSSIEAKAAPARPVTAMKLFELIGGKRDRLVRELGITIEANK